ncbi:hypothetical protein BJX99DRAFT_235114, partial [Aspergillus californicus]
MSAMGVHIDSIIITKLKSQVGVIIMLTMTMTGWPWGGQPLPLKAWRLLSSCNALCCMSASPPIRGLKHRILAITTSAL